MLSSRISPISASASKYTIGWFCVTMPIAVFWSVSNIYQNHSLFPLLVLFHYAHCCLLQSVECLSYFALYRRLVLCHNAHFCLFSPSILCQYLIHTVLSLYSAPQCPLLTATVCPLCLSATHYTGYLFCFIMNTDKF